MWSLLTLFGHFLALSVIWQVWNIWNIIETWYFWLKWGVYQFSTTKGSWNIDFCSIGPLLAPFNLFWSHIDQFWSLLCLFAHFEHFRSSEKYKIDIKESLKHYITDSNEGSTKFLRPKVRELKILAHFYLIWAFLSISGHLRCMKYIKH